jgi:hypothetical protein
MNCLRQLECRCRSFHSNSRQWCLCVRVEAYRRADPQSKVSYQTKKVANAQQKGCKCNNNNNLAWQQTFGFCNTQKIPWLTERISTSEEGYKLLLRIISKLHEIYLTSIYLTALPAADNMASSDRIINRRWAERNMERSTKLLPKYPVSKQIWKQELPYERQAFNSEYHEEMTSHCNVNRSPEYRGFKRKIRHSWRTWGNRIFGLN